MQFMSDRPSPQLSSDSNPAVKHAAVLRDLLARGGSVRQTAHGGVERRLPSGRVAGRYMPGVVQIGIEEGWLVEGRRRPVPFGSRVEIEYRYVAPKADRPEPAPAPKPRRTSRRTSVQKRPREQTLQPVALPDGTEFITRAEAIARWGCSEAAISKARRNGQIDAGPKVPSTVGGPPTYTIALTDRTLAHAKHVWVEGRRTRRTRDRKSAKPERRIDLVDGTEMLQRDLFRAIDLCARQDLIKRLDSVPNRYRDPANPRSGRLYRVGVELVTVARTMGVEIRLTKPSAPRPLAAPKAPFAVEVLTRAEADIRFGTLAWTDPASAWASVETPVFN